LSVENISGTVGGIQRTFQRIDNAAFSRPQKMKKTTQRRPTMTDIAKLTGVSQSTVSLVLTTRPARNSPIPRATKYSRRRRISATG